MQVYIIILLTNGIIYINIILINLVIFLYISRCVQIIIIIL